MNVFFLEVDVQYTWTLFYNDLPFIPERTKIWKVEKLVANLHDKDEYVFHMGNSKQALYQGLILKKVHRMIKFNQNPRLKLYIDMDTKLINIILKNTFSSWWIM